MTRPTKNRRCRVKFHMSPAADREATSLITRKTFVEASVFVGPVTAPARKKKGRIGLDDAAFCLGGRYGDLPYENPDFLASTVTRPAKNPEFGRSFIRIQHPGPSIEDPGSSNQDRVPPSCRKSDAIDFPVKRVQTAVPGFENRPGSGSTPPGRNRATGSR